MPAHAAPLHCAAHPCAGLFFFLACAGAAALLLSLITFCCFCCQRNPRHPKKPRKGKKGQVRQQARGARRARVVGSQASSVRARKLANPMHTSACCAAAQTHPRHPQQDQFIAGDSAGGAPHTRTATTSAAAPGDTAVYSDQYAAYDPYAKPGNVAHV